MKKLKFIIPTIIIATLFFFKIGYNSFTTNKFHTQNIKFIINKGDSFNRIYNRIIKLKIIKENSFSRLYYKIFIHQNNPKIKFGDYFLSKTYNIKSLFEEFTKGTPDMVKITIPEGLTSEQVASIFKKKLNLDSSIFMKTVLSSNSIKNFHINFGKNLRGFLFPQTYYFNKNSNINNVVEIMCNEFNKEFNSIKKINVNNKNNIYDTLIMASIIEKEAARDEDRDKIASVYYNRLKRGMKLQSCPTIRFFTKNYTKPLLYKDLRINNIYNTYLHKGLTPTPICNPGKKSIYAAFHPAKTNFLYFVALANGTRGHHFSKTLKEHNKYKALYKIRKNQK